MKKKTITLLGLGVVSAFLLGGCATSTPVGRLFIEDTKPVYASSPTQEARGLKVGEATCTSYVGLVAVGDASINKAIANSGGIKEIYRIDWKVKNVLGAYGKYTTIVYGK